MSDLSSGDAMSIYDSPTEEEWFSAIRTMLTSITKSHVRTEAHGNIDSHVAAVTLGFLVIEGTIIPTDTKANLAKIDADFATYFGAGARVLTILGITLQSPMWAMERARDNQRITLVPDARRNVLSSWSQFLIKMFPPKERHDSGR